ncbi:hypothetical protein D9M69_505170 [compost metagenome]
MQAAIAAQRGEAAVTDRVVEHAAGDGDFRGNRLGLGIDHGHRSRRGEVVDVDELVVAARLERITLGQRFGALVRNQHFPGRRQGRAVPGGEHVGAGAASAPGIPDVRAVDGFFVVTEGRRRGKTGRHHAEDALLVRVDHGHAASDKTVELDVDDKRAASFGWKRQNGLANRTGGKVRVGTVQTEYKQAQA